MTTFAGPAAPLDKAAFTGTQRAIRSILINIGDSDGRHGRRRSSHTPLPRHGALERAGQVPA